MIKASLLLVVTLAVSRALRRRSAAERHLVWVVALTFAALLPLLSASLPSWQPEIARRAVSALPSLARDGFAGPADSDDIVVRADGIESGTGAMTRALVFVWFGGAILAMLLPMVGWRRLCRYGARRCRPADESWVTTAQDVSRALDHTRPVRLLIAPDDCVPVTWGVFRPTVLLPSSAWQWADDRRRVVLAHELAHVQRADWCVQLVAKLAGAVYWFNPLFWMAYDRVCRESEQACDDAVLSLGIDRREYATHLLEIARTLSCEPPLVPALSMAGPSNLERRFAALLNTQSSRRVPTRRLACVLAAFALLTVLPLAAMTLPGAHATVRIRTGGLPALPESSASSSDAPMVAPIHAVRPRAISGIDGQPVEPPSVAEYSAPPLYSDEARTRRIEGVVTLEIHVDRDGRAEVLRVVKGLGFGLDENAKLAVRHWLFAPARQQGAPIESTTEIDVVFSLANEALNELIANDMATRVGPGVSPPRVVSRVAVQHDDRASDTVGTGSVVLDVVLLEDGTPKVVRVTRSLDPALDQEAVRAFEQWRFSPATRDGFPVKVRMNAEITFHLP